MTPVVYLLTVGQKMVQKNDEQQNKACQRGKKRQNQSLLLVRLSKKKIRWNGIRRNATQSL